MTSTLHDQKREKDGPTNQITASTKGLENLLVLLAGDGPKHGSDEGAWDGCQEPAGSKTKEISMKSIGVKVLITKRIIWTKQTIKQKQDIINMSNKR